MNESISGSREVIMLSHWRIVCVLILLVATPRLACGQIPAASGIPVTTTYSYDVAGHLTSVTTDATGTSNSAKQTRTFTYDGRGLMTSRSEPELAPVSYPSYDSLGHLQSMIDADGTFAYQYDGAERLTQVTANGNPVKQLAYDTSSPGKVYQASRYNYVVFANASHTAQITYTYTYGGLDGWLSTRQLQNTLDGESFTQSFTWNQLGELDSERFPDCDALFAKCTGTASTTATYTYSAGRPTQVSEGGGQATISYYPNGMVNQVTHSNNVVATYGIDPNSMQRPSSISVSGPSGLLWTTGTYSYDGSGNVTQTGNSTYSYDAVNRLVAATVETGAIDTPGSATVQQSFSYDAFGNLQTVSGTASNASVAADSNTNHLSAGTYDGAGNLLTLGASRFGYNELDQLSHYVNGSNEWFYIYDADDERVWSFTLSGPGGNRLDRWTLRSLDNKVRRMFEVTNLGWTSNWSTPSTPTGNTWEDYFYREGTLLAGYINDGRQRHFDVDHLGSVRLETNVAGNLSAGGYHVYYPFGQEIGTTTTQVGERMKFTGQERDFADPNNPENNLDYFHQRESNPVFGRFTSIDSHPGSSKAPQSWNRYAYVLDNPINLTDPDGLAPAPGPGVPGFSDTITVTAVGDFIALSLINLIGGSNLLLGLNGPAIGPKTPTPAPNSATYYPPSREREERVKICIRHADERFADAIEGDDRPYHQYSAKDILGLNLLNAGGAGAGLAYRSLIASGAKDATLGLVTKGAMVGAAEGYLVTTSGKAMVKLTTEVPQEVKFLKKVNSEYVEAVKACKAIRY